MTTINTQNVGTYNLTYTATDEAGNVTTDKRNLFIIPESVQPTLSLEGGDFGFMDATSKSNDTKQYLVTRDSNGDITDNSPDPGFTATDQYQNDVSAYVKIEHFRYYNGLDSNEQKLYDSTLPESGDGTDPGNDNYPIINNYDPENIWFDNIYPPRDPPLDPSNISLNKTQLNSWGINNYKTRYKVRYTLDLPGYNSIIRERTVHIRDRTPPQFTLTTANYSVPQGADVANTEDDAKNKFSYVENYWFITGKKMEGASPSDEIDQQRIGFTVNDVFYTHEDNPTVQETQINTQTKGTWTAHHIFQCSFKDSNNQIINYLPLSDSTDAEKLGKYYKKTRTINVDKDTTEPNIIFKEIVSTSFGGNADSNLRGTIHSTSGLADSNNNTDHGKIVITVAKEMNNTGDDKSLEEVLGSLVTENEIEVTDNLTDSGSINVSYIILHQSFGNNLALTTAVRRSHLGTDFTNDYNWAGQNIAPPPIAGTSDSPAVYTIRYTAIDSEGNSTSKDRTIEIIDATNPVVTFDQNNDNTYKDGLAYNKGHNSGSFSLQSHIGVNTSDNFGDALSTSVAITQSNGSNLFREAYPKNFLSNIYKLKIEDSKFVITDLYDVVQSGNIPIYNADNNTRGTTKYYFDLSHSSLYEANERKFRLFNNDDLITDAATVTDYNVEYTPNGTYNAWMSLNATMFNSSAGGNELKIKQEIVSGNNNYQTIETANNAKFIVNIV